MALVDVRRPIRPHVGAAMAALRADHVRAECADRRLAGHMIGVHDRAMAAIDRAAIDQQVPAAMAADMAQRHRLESLGFASGH